MAISAPAPASAETPAARSGRRAASDRLRALAALAAGEACAGRVPEETLEELVRDDLARRDADGVLRLTEAGLAHWRRAGAPPGEGFAVQHGERRLAEQEDGPPLTVNEAESTLAWLRRRKGPDGAPLIDDVQFAAGERLRADLTRAQIMPRVTANWTAAVAGGRRAADVGVATDAMIAARQRVDAALSAVGPEFSGLLIDVCGFLKRLPDIERERRWPARSAKLVLDMALTRLARHYGLQPEARGPERAKGMRFWGAADYRPTVDGA